MMVRLTLPTLLTIVATVFFLSLERIAPGRRLPPVKNWYARALAINLAQLLITLSLNQVFVRALDGASLFQLAAWNMPALEGFSAWLVGTFFFYWWHRLRHVRGCWRLFHQIHHSPARIEAVTSFYKHPLEILSDSLLAALVLYPLLGCSLTGAFWNNFFAATAEYLYHANFKSPRWLRYFIQTPELHSVHHELDVHRYNFSDLPLWDRLFGTYRDATEFAEACGFPRNLNVTSGTCCFSETSTIARRVTALAEDLDTGEPRRTMGSNSAPAGGGPVRPKPWPMSQ